MLALPYLQALVFREPKMLEQLFSSGQILLATTYRNSMLLVQPPNLNPHQESILHQLSI